MKCCICNKEIKGYGHNARPLFDGRCCDNCNQLVIIERTDKRKCTNNSDKGKCSKCMSCCTDFIPLTQEDIFRIKNYMKTHPVERNVMTDASGNYLVLCPFLSESGCQIYPVRPEVCRGFSCWHNNFSIKKNKVKCLANAVVNGKSNYKSLHEIFWDDAQFGNKLMEAMFMHEQRRIKEENKM